MTLFVIVTAGRHGDFVTPGPTCRLLPDAEGRGQKGTCRTRCDEIPCLPKVTMTKKHYCILLEIEHFIRNIPILSLIADGGVHLLLKASVCSPSKEEDGYHDLPVPISNIVTSIPYHSVDKSFLYTRNAIVEFVEEESIEL